MNSPYPLDAAPELAAEERQALAGRSLLLDGVFVGNYSLAIVNRNLAGALLRAGLKVSCFTPEPNWETDTALSEVGELRARMLPAYPEAGEYDVHLRNTWPPETADMVGRVNAYVCFAWEECDVPLYVIDRFNRDLDLLMVTSTFVAKAFRHSGLTVPVAVVGNGCDHVLQVTPARRPPVPRRGRKRVLHVSTCFPRKGVDRLLEGFCANFDHDSNIELLIKTEPNPHNRIYEQVAAVRAKYPSAAPVEVIETGLSREQMVALYRSANLLVSPSRGEGFGLPLAEALLHGVPVSATAYSGQTDFCAPRTSFPIDYTLQPSQAHVAGAYSLWADPSPESIAKQIREAVDHPLRARLRTLRGARLIRRHFTWDRVVERVMKALARPAAGGVAAAPRSWNIDLVSTWQQQCGISTYSGHLFGTGEFRPRLARVLARQVTDDDRLAGKAPSDGAPVLRVWGTERSGVLALCREIAAGTSPVLWFQHHPGHFSPSDMRLVAEALRNSRYAVRALTLHNAIENARSGDLDWTLAFDVVFVHSPKDAALVSEAGHPNPVVIPHGIARAKSRGGRQAMPGSFTVGTFGFLFPHKNIEVLTAAVAIARDYIPGLRLTLLNAMAGTDPSRLSRARVETLIERLSLDNVSARFDFMDEAEVIDELSACDLIAFVYGDSTETATGAARIALIADRPLLCSPSSVLADLHPIAHVSAAVDAATVAEALITLHANPDMRAMYDLERRKLAADFSYERLALRYAAHIESLLEHGHA